MTISLNGTLPGQCKIVVGCTAAALTGAAGDGDYVSLKNYRRCTVIIQTNNATTVTASDVTALQATAVAGTSAKALGIARHWYNIDTGAADALTMTATTANTFATSTTDNKDQVHVFEIDSQDLDVAGGFDCVRVDVAGAVNSVGAVIYILWGARYAGDPLAAITD